MATIDAGLLTLIIILIIGICVLVFVGIHNIRRGLQNSPQAQTRIMNTLWHKQPKVLFGLNNIVFALILLAILFLGLFTTATVRYVLFGLIGLLLIMSVVLVIYTMMASLALVRNLQMRSPPHEQAKVDKE